MIGDLEARIPSGPLDRKWTSHKDHARLVSPNNRRKFEIIMVGSGLAGGSAAATLGELGYRVKCFCYQDSARRAHSIAAQGGINAAKNYQNDGDSVYRLFYDTIKGGDFRSREANVYRLAEVSSNIIDQCVAQGVPFAPTKKARSSPTLVLLRSIPPAFPIPAIISRNLRSCPNHCAMTDAFGSRSERKMPRNRRTKFRKLIVTITSNENIRVTETFRRATFHRARSKKFATKV